MDFRGIDTNKEDGSKGSSSLSSDVMFRLKSAAGQYDSVTAEMIKIGAEMGADPSIAPLRTKWHNNVRGLTDANCLAKAIVDMASNDPKAKTNSAPLIQAVMSGSFFDAGKMILKLGLPPADISDIEHSLGEKCLILKDAAATLAFLSAREFKDPNSALEYAKTQLMSNEKIMSLVSGLFNKS